MSSIYESNKPRDNSNFSQNEKYQLEEALRKETLANEE